MSTTQSIFSIFRRSQALPDYSFLGVDMHSHVLPGIDDGASDLAASLDLIGGLQDLGFHTLYATPHVMQSLYPNTPDTIKGALARVQSKLVNSHPALTLNAAAEYQTDDHFPQLLFNKELLCLPGKRVLIEMSFHGPNPNLEALLFDLQVAGYQPIMAHPERYRYWRGKHREWQRVIRRGCLLQLNILSLLGAYGEKTRKWAYEMLDQDLITYLGTDCHNEQQLARLRSGLRDRRLARALKNKEFANATLR